MKKIIDADLLVIKRCCKALESSSSKTMFRANMEFLIDKYVTYQHKVALAKKKKLVPTASLRSQGYSTFTLPLRRRSVGTSEL